MGTFLFEKRDVVQETDASVSYLPGGKPTQACGIDGSNLRGLFQGISQEWVRLDELVNEASFELDPFTTTKLIEEWEDAVGIPDDCFTVEGIDIEQRQRQVIAKLAGDGTVTQADFERIGAILGFDIKVFAGGELDTFDYTFPIIFKSPRARRFTMTVVINVIPGTNETFDYIFPFVFGLTTTQALECYIRKLAPSNVLVEFIYDTGAKWNNQEIAWQDTDFVKWETWG